MVSSSQIRNELAFYLAGVIPLEDFEDWFALKTWNIHKMESKAAEVLAFAIEEAFSEYTLGHISEDKLRKELSQVLYAETKSAEIVVAPQQAWRSEPLLFFRSSAVPVSAPVPVQP